MNRPIFIICVVYCDHLCRVRARNCSAPATENETFPFFSEPPTMCSWATAFLTGDLVRVNQGDTKLSGLVCWKTSFRLRRRRGDEAAVNQSDHCPCPSRRGNRSSVNPTTSTWPGRSTSDFSVVVGHYAQFHCFLSSDTRHSGRWWAGRVAAYWLLIGRHASQWDVVSLMTTWMSECPSLKSMNQGKKIWK